MRRGKVVSVKNTGDVDEKEISRLMIGKSIFSNLEKSEGSCHEAVLRIENVSITKKHQDRPILDRLSFQASTCEIVE